MGKNGVDANDSKNQGFFLLKMLTNQLIFYMCVLIKATILNLMGHRTKQKSSTPDEIRLCHAVWPAHDGYQDISVLE